MAESSGLPRAVWKAVKTAWSLVAQMAACSAASLDREKGEKRGASLEPSWATSWVWLSAEYLGYSTADRSVAKSASQTALCLAPWKASRKDLTMAEQKASRTGKSKVAWKATKKAVRSGYHSAVWKD